MNVQTTTDIIPCLDWGDGPPILFIHGAACDYRIWTPHVEYLVNRYRCIAPTLRWFGTTSWRPDGAKFGEVTHANDLANLIEALGCGPVFLVGWSYGANVALRLAVDRPDLISGVAVYEPSSTGLVSDDAEFSKHQISMRKTFQPIMDAAAAGDQFKCLKAFIDAVDGGGVFANLPAALRQICLDNAHTLTPLLNAKQRIDPISAHEVKDLPMPAHVAWGEWSGDVWTIPSKATAKIANVCGEEIPGTNHVWPAKDPIGFSTWLKTILHPVTNSDEAWFGTSP